MADTALDLITNALLDIGVLADSETPTASQAAGGLRKLNNMLDAWGIENLLVYGQTGYVLPTVAAQGVYTVGPSGNLNIPRPNKINNASVRDTTSTPANTYDYPLYIYSDEEWAQLPFKSETGNWPSFGIYVNYTYPLISVYLNPIPTSNQYQIILWVDGDFATFALDDLVNLAPGYQRAIESNLALELAGAYGVEVPTTVQKIAQESKTRLKINNYRPNILNINYRLLDDDYFDYRIG